MLVLRSVLTHHALIFELARRDILDRYLNQAIGGLWAIANPLLLMWLYVTLFTLVFPTRLGSGTDPWEGVIYLLSGLVCWLFSVEVITRSTLTIADNGHLVKQIVFPVETLPTKTVVVAAFSFSVTLIVLLAIVIAVRPGLLPGVALLAPLALGLHLGFLLGVSFLLAAVGPFLRDLKDLVAFFAACGLFLAPILYAPERIAALPPALHALMVMNPFSHFVWIYQDAFFSGAFGHPMSWAVCGVLSFATLALGTAVFRRLGPMFGDVV